MSKTSKSKSKSFDKKYSKIQYFFWLLSGAEINILKDCPTDYNRQAGIGFTIFMTTLLAFFFRKLCGLLFWGKLCYISSFWDYLGFIDI